MPITFTSDGPLAYKQVVNSAYGNNINRVCFIEVCVCYSSMKLTVHEMSMQHQINKQRHQNKMAPSAAFAHPWKSFIVREGWIQLDNHPKEQI